MQPPKRRRNLCEASQRRPLATRASILRPTPGGPFGHRKFNPATWARGPARPLPTPPTGADARDSPFVLVVCVDTVYIHSTVFAYSDGGVMEHLVRVYNERDRRTLEWLRNHVGDATIAAAVKRCAGDKPFLSSVCRQIGVRPPNFPAAPRRAPTETGEQALATIRAMLAAKVGATSGTTARMH